jgi:hypothetical protein
MRLNLQMISCLAAVGVVASNVASAIAADPADPTAPVPASGYRSITSGTKSYRPVEPLPWGDVNRRVAPPGALPTPMPPPPGKRGALPGAADVAQPRGSREIREEANRGASKAPSPEPSTPQQHNKQ